MSLLRSLLSCLIVLCLPLSQAAQNNKTRAKNKATDLILGNDLKKALNSEQASENMIRFSIEGHSVVAMLHNRYKKVQLIYLFPNAPAAPDCKEKLTKAAEDLRQFLQPKKAEAPIHIQKAGTYAQILIDSNATISNGLIEQCTTNAALYFNKLLGPPLTWRDNRLIWQIIFNSKSSCLEVALDISKDKLGSLDMKLLGKNPGNRAVMTQINQSLKLNLRTSQSTAEMKSWREATGFTSPQILGMSGENTGSKKAGNYSVYLIKKDDWMRLARKIELKHSPESPQKWVLSAPLSFPAECENLSAGQTTNPALAANDDSSDGASGAHDAPAPPSVSAAPTASSLTPDQKLTPKQALEAYIRNLEMM